MLESHVTPYGVGREAKVMEWNLVSEADATVVSENNVPSETGTNRADESRPGRRARQGRARPRHPIRTAEPDIVFGPRHPPVPLPPPRRRGTAVGMPPVVRPITGHRRLRDTDSRRDDGMAGRIPGPERLPGGSTAGRSPAGADGRTKCRRSAE